MAYYPAGDPRNADPNVRPGDGRQQYQYDKDGNVVWDRPLSSDELASNDDALTSAWNMVSDPFSSETARTGTIDGRDFFLGGDAQLRDQTLAAMQGRGEENWGVIGEVGAQEYNALTPYAKAAHDQGQKDYQTLSRYAPQLSTLGGKINSSAQYQSGLASGLSTQVQGYANGVKTYGDQYQQRNWQEATGALKGFSPSARSQWAGNALSNYDAGPVGANLQSSYDALTGYADRGPGPSAAEAQLRSGADEAMGNALSLARSGRGAGANAAAMRQAMFVNAGTDSQLSANMAQLRAQEEATWRQQQLSALNAAGGIASAQEQARQGAAGLNLSALGNAASLYAGQDQSRLSALSQATGQYGAQVGQTVQAQAAADAARQNYFGQAVNAQQAAAGQSQAGWDAYLGAMNNSAGIVSTAGAQAQSALSNGANMQNTAGQNRLASVQAGLGSRAAYDQAYLGTMENEAGRRTTLANTRLAEDSANSRANQATDAAADSSITGMAGAALGALAAL